MWSLATTGKKKRPIRLFWVFWSSRSVRGLHQFLTHSIRQNWVTCPQLNHSRGWDIASTRVREWGVVNMDSLCHRISVRAIEWYSDWSNFSWITSTLTILLLPLSTSDGRTLPSWETRCQCYRTSENMNFHSLVCPLTLSSWKSRSFPDVTNWQKLVSMTRS